MRSGATWLMTLALAVPLSAPIADVGLQDAEPAIVLISDTGDPVEPTEETGAGQDASPADTASLPPAPIYRIPKGVGKERSRTASGRRGGYSRPAPARTPDDGDAPE